MLLPINVSTFSRQKKLTEKFKLKINYILETQRRKQLKRKFQYLKNYIFFQYDFETEKSCIALYYRQFSMNNKIKIIKLILILLAFNKFGLILNFFILIFAEICL